MNVQENSKFKIVEGLLKKKVETCFISFKFFLVQLELARESIAITPQYREQEWNVSNDCLKYLQSTLNFKIHLGSQPIDPRLSKAYQKHKCVKNSQRENLIT